MSEEPKKEKTKVFSHIIPSINKKFEHVINSGEITESEYPSFLIDKYFSMNKETLIFASEMNCRPNINKKAHYDFYFYGIPKNPYRYVEYVKRDSVDNLEYVMDYFKLSREKSIEALKVLSDDDIKDIKKSILSRSDN